MRLESGKQYWTCGVKPKASTGISNKKTNVLSAVVHTMLN